MPADFSIVHRVQFSETDAAGVVHFSNFFRMMEEVEHAFFRSRGLSVMMVHESVELGWPRVSVSCDFLAPLRFEEEVELRFHITKLGGKSLNYEVEFVRGETRIALGKATSVCCHMTDQGMKATAIPAAIRAKLEE